MTEPSKTPRWEVQEINGSDGHNYRITDTLSDSRLATCYDAWNADYLVDQLNRVESLERELAAANEARERAEKNLQDCSAILCLSANQVDEMFRRAQKAESRAAKAAEEMLGRCKSTVNNLLDGAPDNHVFRSGIVLAFGALCALPIEEKKDE